MEEEREGKGERRGKKQKTENRAIQHNHILLTSDRWRSGKQKFSIKSLYSTLVQEPGSSYQGNFSHGGNWTWDLQSVWFSVNPQLPDYIWPHSGLCWLYSCNERFQTYANRWSKSGGLVWDLNPGSYCTSRPISHVHVHIVSSQKTFISIFIYVCTFYFFYFDLNLQHKSGKLQNLWNCQTLRCHTLR